MSGLRISLDGAWDFMHVQSGQSVKVRKIEVPAPWQAQFEDLRRKGGTGVYRRFFELPPDWLHGQGRIHLCFGAVFHNTRVWLNDAPVGANEGGFLPFSFDITERLVAGPNEIKLRVESPSDDPAEFPETPFAELSFGKQSWYGPLSGIWQPVFLERRQPEHIVKLRLSPELASGRVRIRLFLSQPLMDDAEIEMSVHDGEGGLAASAVDVARAGTAEVGTEIYVPGHKPWSPATPNLYRITAQLRRRSQILDKHEDHFGFRTIETRNGRFYLNGELVYLRGALDQDYYPDGICTLPSVEFVEDQFRKAKELGLNLVRCHIKAADPRYYHAADRIGLLVWTELPNGGLSTERSRARKEATLKGIVDRDYNHPSIVIWTIINENWGVDLVHDADHRNWLKQTFHWLKSYDPTRLVVDNSPLGPSFHVETDIADYHFYAGYPDYRHSWDRFVDELADRADWLYSPEGDAVRTGDEPLMCSEFGNWGLPNPDDLKNGEGSEPWWFETGHDWGEGIMYPHGVENRFADWSLDRVFGTLQSFIEATQWQQFFALKYAIAAMRRKPSIAGYVITEFTDCHWESNGLLDMRRNRRVFHDIFTTINADTMIVPKWERVSYWAGETVEFDIAIAHGAGRRIKNAELRFGFALEHSIGVRRVEPGTVRELGRIAVPIPAEAGPEMRTVDFELRAEDGTRLASNRIDIAIHARPSPQQPSLGGLWSPDEDIRERLAALDYDLAGGLDEAALVVARRHDPQLANYVRRGGRLVLLPEAEGTLNPFFPHWQGVQVRSRDGTLWRGDWASSFAWLRRGKAFGHMPGGPLLDASFDRVLPTHIITGCNLLDFQGRVYAGLTIGWIHKPVALTVEKPYGNGRLVASTLRLFRDAPGADPTATMLLDGLVRLGLGPLRHPEGIRSEAVPSMG